MRVTFEIENKSVECRSIAWWSKWREGVSVAVVLLLRCYWRRRKGERRSKQARKEAGALVFTPNERDKNLRPRKYVLICDLRNVKRDKHASVTRHRGLQEDYPR